MALWTLAEIETALWLDASDASTITIATGVSQWRDKSGNARHFSQATTTRQPAVISGGLNGLDVLRFNGSSHGLGASITIPAGNWSAYFVVKPAVTSHSGGMYLLDTQTGRMILAALKPATLVGCYFGSWIGSAAGTTAAQVLEYYLDAAAGAGGSKILRNASVLESITYSAKAIGGLSAIGAAYDFGVSPFFQGDVCEIALIPAAASLETRQKVQGRLHWKWGLQDLLPADHPYKAAAPTIADKVTLSLDQPCSLAQQLITLSLDQPVALRKLLTLSLDQSCGLELAMLLVQRCRAMPTVTLSLNQWLRDLRRVTLRLDQHVGVCPSVKLSLDQWLRMPGRVTLSLDQPLVIAGQQIALSLDQPLRLDRNGRVTLSLAQPCAIATDAAILQQISLTVTVGGRVVGPDFVSLKADDGDGFLSATIRFPDYRQYLLCRVGEEVIITELLDNLPAEITVLEVKSLANPEEPGAADHILTAISPTVALDDEPLTDDLGPGVAASLMTALAAEYGITLDWQGVTGWPFLAGELLAEDETAYAVLVRLAAASGAFVQSLPDGATIRLRPEYAVNVGAWPTAATELELNDQDHILSLDEQPEERDGCNAFLVSGQSAAAGNYRLDDTVISATVKELRGYIVPWARSAGVYLDHTGGDWVTIDDLGPHNEAVTDEDVVIEAGLGRLTRPCYGLISWRYKEDGLGALQAEEDGSLATAEIGDALLDVTYTTRYRKWRGTDPRAESVLYYLDDKVVV